MMMQALSAGGMPVLSDHQRAADEDNPRGYFELELAKRIEQDSSWLPRAQGRAVKLVSPLLRHLPATYGYQIIFMKRDLTEILASQQVMLRRRAATAGGNDATVGRAFERHLAEAAAWITTQANMEVVYVDYHGVLVDPLTQMARIRTFLRRDLALDALVAAVDPRLRRQRAGQRGA